ncbi:cytochrome c [Acidobacteria bacterium AH-259-D05]|nr:cytochrome c [Acidobacteria bacterium AH-259-D05]
MGLAGGLVLLLTAILQALPAQASHQAASEQETAWQLVLERCYLCHYLDRPDFKFAPSLKDLFQRQSQMLMNGKPVNDETVSEWIAEGSPNMPAFKYTLSPQQIQLIVKFLKEGQASNIPMIRNSR